MTEGPKVSVEPLRRSRDPAHPARRPSPGARASPRAPRQAVLGRLDHRAEKFLKDRHSVYGIMKRTQL